MEAVRGTNRPVRDPALSKEGEEQARQLGTKVHNFPELVVCAPSLCALQTALLAFGSPSRLIVPNKWLRETSKMMPRQAHVGKPQREEYKGRVKADLMDAILLRESGARDKVDWNQLEAGEWWSNTVVSTADSCKEGLLLREWLLKRQENKIALVGHSNKLHNIVKESSKPAVQWPKSAVAYYCFLVVEAGFGYTHGDLVYGGTTPQEAATKLPSGVRSKCVLILKHARTCGQAEKTDAKRKTANSTQLPSKKQRPLPHADAPSASTGTVAPPIFQIDTKVLINGIEKRPELNGRSGKVVSFDGGTDRRYRVNIAGNVLSLREDKLSRMNDTAPPTSSEKPVDVMQEENEESQSADVTDVKKMPLGKLTPTGSLIPTYSWVRVPVVASLPPGLEVRMPLDGVKCARIPSTWRLQLVLHGECDAYRCDVNRTTLLSNVMSGAAKAFGCEAQALQLLVDDKPLDFTKKTTISSANLFGSKLAARRKG